MKKFLKFILILFVSFSFINSVGAIPSACDGKVINADTYYHPYGYQARVKICQLANCREDGDTGCQFSDTGTAQKWCEREYTSAGYKGSYHTVRTGKCSTEKIFKCTTCSASGCPEACEIPGCVKTATNDCIGTCYTGTDKLDLNKASLEKLTDAEVEAQVQAFLEKNANCRVASCDPYTYKVVYNTCDCVVKDDYVTDTTLYQAKFSTKGESGEDIPVYCVSPALANAGSSNVYTIDATHCESSNSTKDCGYANIMIEGYYRNKILNIDSYDYAVISDAMHLWGAYIGQDGYRETGIADEDGRTIDDENDWLRFVPESDDTYKNVFKGTLEELFKNVYFESIHGGSNYSVYNVVDPDTGDTYNIPEQNRLRLISATCSKTAMLCGTSTKYIKALYLFVNTVQGNPKMQEHLDEINKVESGVTDDIIHNDPVSAGVTVMGETIRITFNLRKGVEIYCNSKDIDEAKRLGCKIEQDIIIKDSTGKEIVIENIQGYDYCIKNTCFIDLVEYSDDILLCDQIEKVTIKTQHYKTCGEESVKKYVSCGSPTTTQLMFSFEPDYKCKEGSSEEKIIEVVPQCNLCDEGVKYSNSTCSKDEKQDYVVNTTSDPSLNCILHKSSSVNENNQNGKAYYDYSSLFNVNTNFCRVYCSDKVTYYLAPKQTVNSSLQLKYDIERFVYPTRENLNSNALTSIVMVKRDCVSNIYYNNIFDFNKDWKAAYGIDKNVNNWNELYDELLILSSKENDRVDVLNQVIYDLYNCNFFEEKYITGNSSLNGGIIQRPKDSINAYSKALELLNNTNEYCDGIDCVTGKIKYEGGAEYITAKDNNIYRTGADYEDPVLSTSEVVSSLLDVKYCSNDKCFRGITDSGKYEEDYDEAGVYETATVQFGNKGEVVIPDNDYAIFSYSVEADLFNSTLYQVEEYTGKVQVVNDTNYNSKYLDLNKNTYPVSSYAKQLCSLNPDGTSSCDVDYKFSVPLIVDYNKNKTSSSKVIAFYRKFSNDDLIDTLSEHDYICQYDVSDPVPDGGSDKVGFAFKNIDISDPFPTGMTDRPNSNWSWVLKKCNDKDKETNYKYCDYYEKDGSLIPKPEVEKYKNYIKTIVSEIEESGKNHLYATDEYKEYSYKITNESIEAIREDNKINGYFTKPYNCEIDSENGIYLNCNSEFLDRLHSSDNPFSVEVIKDDGISDYTKKKGLGN